MNKIFFFVISLILCVFFLDIAGAIEQVVQVRKVKVFNNVTVNGVGNAGTSTGYDISRTEEYGLGWLVTEGTSTAHIGINYQISMDNVNYSAESIEIVNDETTAGYTGTSSLTLPITGWVRFLVEGETSNATNTKVTAWFLYR